MELSDGQGYVSDLVFSVQPELMQKLFRCFHCWSFKIVVTFYCESGVIIWKIKLNTRKRQIK